MHLKRVIIKNMFNELLIVLNNITYINNHVVIKLQIVFKSRDILYINKHVDDDVIISEFYK